MIAGSLTVLTTAATAFLLVLWPGSTSAIFSFGPGAFIFQTSSRPPAAAAQNNTAGSFTSNISFDAISNVSNVVVAVSQTMGRSLDDGDLSDDGSMRQQHINSSIFLFKDGNWTSYRLRKRRSTFDLAKQITNQVFAAVNSFMNQTANQTTYDLIDKLLNASATFNNRSSRQASSPLDPFAGIDLFDEAGQDLLNDLESSPAYSKMQRGILLAIPRNLRAVRSRGWRALLEDFSAFSYVARSSIQTLQFIFNNVVDRFYSGSHDATTTGKCWPNEANLNRLSSLFRTSADTMGQCYGKVFLDSRTVLDNIRGNFSTPLSLPMELFQQFNYCGSLNTDESDDAFSVLAESVCMAKMPMLLDTYALNTRLSFNRQIDQSRQMMLLIRGSLLQCTLTELEAIQTESVAWNTAYNQCMTTNAETTTLSN